VDLAFQSFPVITVEKVAHNLRNIFIPDEGMLSRSKLKDKNIHILEYDTSHHADGGMEEWRANIHSQIPVVLII